MVCGWVHFNDESWDGGRFADKRFTVVTSPTERPLSVPRRDVVVVFWIGLQFTLFAAINWDDLSVDRFKTSLPFGVFVPCEGTL